MQDREKQKKLGFLMVILAGALWGITGTVTKYIYAYGIQPATLGFLRIGISFISLYLFAILSGRRVRLKKEDALIFIGFGAISVAAFNVLYLTSIQLTTVTTAVVLLYTAPAFSLLAARIILKESLTPRKIVAVVVTFVGVFLLVEAYKPGQLLLHVPGVLTGLGSGLTYGVYSIFSKAALKRGYGSLETVIIALGFGFLFMAFVHPPWRLVQLATQPMLFWLLIVVVAVFCTMVAYVLFVTGLVQVEAGKATLIASVEPVVAIIAAMIFLGESITFIQFIGVIAVLSAVVAQNETGETEDLLQEDRDIC